MLSGTNFPLDKWGVSCLITAMCGVLMLASCTPKKAHRFAPLSSPNATVWAMQETGNYYCLGSVMFGRKPGVVMKQVQAIDRGYQPALTSYCPDLRRSSQVTFGSHHTR